MMSDFHCLRPLWLTALLPWLMLLIFLWRQKPKLNAWDEICDPQLLAALVQSTGLKPKKSSLITLFLSLLCIILSLSGPAWLQLPVPTFQPIQPKVLVLDMSEHMLQNDLTPNRLTRAKFKIHDLVTSKSDGQFGLIAFTNEPFVVSPLTQDGSTIDALLPMLTPDVMPVQGQDLESALSESQALLKNAGFHQGQILVFTADTPSYESIQLVKAMAKQGITTSIMPMIADPHLNPLFTRFAKEGKGQVFPYESESAPLKTWLKQGVSRQLAINQQDEIPLWRDEGRWLLIPALLFLLPVFQRKRLSRGAL